MFTAESGDSSPNTHHPTPNTKTLRVFHITLRVLRETLRVLDTAYNLPHHLLSYNLLTFDIYIFEFHQTENLLLYIIYK